MAERLKIKLLESDRLVDLVAGPDAYRDIPRLLDTIEVPQAHICKADCLPHTCMLQEQSDGGLQGLLMILWSIEALHATGSRKHKWAQT